MTRVERRPQIRGTGRHHWAEVARRQRREERERRGSTDFRTYHVGREQLPVSRAQYERQDAITHARGQAIGDGFRVVDIVQATYQDSGDWLVEMQVEAAA